MKPLTFLPPAEEELTEAYLYLMARSRVLAADFLSCVRLAARQVQRNPGA